MLNQSAYQDPTLISRTNEANSGATWGSGKTRGRPGTLLRIATYLKKMTQIRKVGEFGRRPMQLNCMVTIFLL
jgi:hypothetical protein